MAKIIISANTSFNLFNFRLSLIQALQTEGFEVIALAPVDEYTEELEKEVNFIPLRFLDRKGLNPLKESLFFHELLKYYKKIAPNLVINFTIKNNFYGTLAASILGIKRISVVTGLGYLFLGNSSLKILFRNIYKQTLKLSNKVVFQNKDDLLEFSYLGEKAVLVPGSGVDTEKFNPEFGKKKNLKTIYDFLFVGRLLKDKGIYELIEATKLLKGKGLNFRLALLGKIDKGNPTAIKESELKQWESQGLVEYLGYTKDVRSFICQAKSVILPSYREGLPRSLLEAMSMEKPIITTAIPGCNEVCLNGINCLKVKPKDVFSLAQAMEKFLQLPLNKVHEMGKEGRKLVLEKYSSQIVNKIFLNLVREVLDGV